MTKESRSKYILLTPWDEPTEIDIYNWKDGGLYINYLVRTFQEFEKLSLLSGLTFYVIWHHIKSPICRVTGITSLQFLPRMKSA